MASLSNAVARNITANFCRLKVLRCNFRGIHLSSQCAVTFWEPDKKGGEKYKSKEEFSNWFHLKNGLKQLRPEFKLFCHEIKTHLQADVPVIKPGDYDVIWTFNTEEDIKKWNSVCDSDHNEGFSSSSFKFNDNKMGHFSGILNPRPPKDGILKWSGYAGIKIPRVTKSFKRKTFIDWLPWTHLLLKVRGDGRVYNVNIQCEGDFDILWHDTYTFGLYTRGGPYWQIAKIPFSKFFLTSKGRIQDKQESLPRDCITSIGITLMDNIPGPFSLEIDSIGVYNQPGFEEEFAYEMYKVPSYAVGF